MTTDEGRRACGDPRRRPGATATAAVGQGRLADARDLRPEDPAAEEHQGGWQHDQRERRGDHDTDRAGEPEAPRRRERARAAGVSRPRTTVVALASTASAVRRRARRMASRRSGVAAQLVAVARDEQQRVVGARAEDQHRQDADGRLVPGRRRVRASVWVASTAASLVGDAHDEQRDDPQDRAAVGDHEQDRDDRGGGREQAEVGAVEDGGEVGLDGRRAGDLGADPSGAFASSWCAHRVDRVGDVRGAGGRDGEDADRRLAVRARDDHRAALRHADVARRRDPGRPGSARAELGQDRRRR